MSWDVCASVENVRVAIEGLDLDVIGNAGLQPGQSLTIILVVTNIGYNLTKRFIFSSLAYPYGFHPLS